MRPLFECFNKLPGACAQIFTLDNRDDYHYYHHYILLNSFKSPQNFTGLRKNELKLFYFSIMEIPKSLISTENQSRKSGLFFDWEGEKIILRKYHGGSFPFVRGSTEIGRYNGIKIKVAVREKIPKPGSIKVLTSVRHGAFKEYFNNSKSKANRFYAFSNIPSI